MYEQKKNDCKICTTKVNNRKYPTNLYKQLPGNT